MRMQPLIKYVIALAFLFGMVTLSAQASSIEPDEQITIDRIQLVTQQINLLQNRLNQGERELKELQQQHDKQITSLSIEKATKNLIDKAALDISVSKSNVDSANIELTDTRQTIVWLEKVSEIENQINVLSIFGLKVAKMK